MSGPRDTWEQMKKEYPEGTRKEPPQYRSETTERGNVIMLTVFRNDQILGSLTFFEHERDEVLRWEELVGKLNQG